MAYRFVLCATDLSEGSAVALRQSAELARADSARLGVIMILPDPLGPHPLDLQSSGDLYTEVPAVQSNALEALTTHVSNVLGEGGAAAQLWVEHGIPYAVILERAEALGVDLLVVGARGRSGLERALLGSVTDKAVRHAHCSVLVARERQGDGVLAATDFSVASRRAVSAAAEHARRMGTKLTVLHSVGMPPNFLLIPAPVPAPGMTPPPGVFPSVDRSALLREAQNQLEGLRSELGLQYESLAVEGDPGAEIVRTAEERSMKLIAVGSVGRTGLARLLLGSVSEQVVRAAPCSVLVVR